MVHLGYTCPWGSTFVNIYTSLFLFCLIVYLYLRCCRNAEVRQDNVCGPKQVSVLCQTSLPTSTLLSSMRTYSCGRTLRDFPETPFVQLKEPISSNSVSSASSRSSCRCIPQTYLRKSVSFSDTSEHYRPDEDFSVYRRRTVGRDEYNCSIHAPPFLKSTQGQLDCNDRYHHSKDLGDASDGVLLCPVAQSCDQHNQEIDTYDDRISETCSKCSIPQSVCTRDSSTKSFKHISSSKITTSSGWIYSSHKRDTASCVSDGSDQLSENTNDVCSHVTSEPRSMPVQPSGSVCKCPSVQGTDQQSREMERDYEKNSDQCTKCSIPRSVSTQKSSCKSENGSKVCLYVTSEPRSMPVQRSVCTQKTSEPRSMPAQRSVCTQKGSYKSAKHKSSSILTTSTGRTHGVYSGDSGSKVCDQLSENGSIVCSYVTSEPRSMPAQRSVCTQKGSYKPSKHKSSSKLTTSTERTHDTQKGDMVSKVCDQLSENGSKVCSYVTSEPRSMSVPPSGSVCKSPSIQSTDHHSKEMDRDYEKNSDQCTKCSIPRSVCTQKRSYKSDKRTSSSKLKTSNGRSKSSHKGDTTSCVSDHSDQLSENINDVCSRVISEPKSMPAPPSGSVCKCPSIHGTEHQSTEIKRGYEKRSDECTKCTKPQSVLTSSYKSSKLTSASTRKNICQGQDTGPSLGQVCDQCLENESDSDSHAVSSHTSLHSPPTLNSSFCYPSLRKCTLRELVQGEGRELSCQITSSKPQACSDVPHESCKPEGEDCIPKEETICGSKTNHHPCEVHHPSLTVCGESLKKCPAHANVRYVEIELKDGVIMSQIENCILR